MLVTGENLKDAQAQLSSSGGEAMVNLEFDKTGAKLFAEATAANVGKPIAIVLDGKTISAPTVNEPIPNGQAQISGNFTAKEAQDLAVLLRSGALPVSLQHYGKENGGTESGQRFTGL